MSSPGAGKTTTLTKTIAAMKHDFRIGVMEADIDSAVDADTISETGAKVIQLHTGGMCHLDADMTRQGLLELDTSDVDLAILENVGNLVCPAEFDTGAVKNAMILSVPEGDDKPLKYPLMFQVCQCLLINKIDVLPYFDFDLEECKKRVLKLGQMITDRVGVKVTVEDPEYWGLAEVLTDEMAEVCLSMKVRKPMTLEQIARKSGKDPERVQKLLDEMSVIGMIEYNWENADHHKQYVLPMFVPGCAEFMMMNDKQVEEHPILADFFENMSRLPLEKVTPMVPPGGSGIGMHVIPVEKAIPAKQASASVEHISHWLKKYQGKYAVGACSCRRQQRVRGEGCGEIEGDLCIGVGDMADYLVETGKGHYITQEEVLEILERAE